MHGEVGTPIRQQVSRISAAHDHLGSTAAICVWYRVLACHSTGTSSEFITLKQVTRTTGLPKAWLRSEADARRLPCIRAGRVRMFDTEAVRQALETLQWQEGENGN